MSLFRRLADPLNLADKVERTLGNTATSALRLTTQGPLGNAGDLKTVASTPVGSILSGRVVVQRGIKPLGSNARTLDIFGSPATAGTNQQTVARTSAVIFGAAAGASALGLGAGAGAGASSSWWGAAGAAAKGIVPAALRFGRASSSTETPAPSLSPSPLVRIDPVSKPATGGNDIPIFAIVGFFLFAAALLIFRKV